MNEPGRRLEIQIALHGDADCPAADIRVIGEFDRLQAERFDESANALPKGLRALSVDLTATTIIDSAALGCLVRLRHVLDGSNCRFDVVVQKPFQIVVMKVGGLYDFLNVRTANDD